MPKPGDHVTAQGRVVGEPGESPFSCGQVLGADGSLVATCTQRGRYVPVMPPDAPPGFALPDAGAALVAVLGAEVVATERGASVRLPVSPRVQNPLGNVHGGVSIAVCDLAAMSALAGVGVDARTSSIHVTYLRPIPAASVADFVATVWHAGRSLAVVDVEGRVGDRVCVLGRVCLDVLH